MVAHAARVCLRLAPSALRGSAIRTRCGFAHGIGVRCVCERYIGLAALGLAAIGQRPGPLVREVQAAPRLVAQFRLGRHVGDAAGPIGDQRVGTSGFNDYVGVGSLLFPLVPDRRCAAACRAVAGQGVFLLVSSQRVQSA